MSDDRPKHEAMSLEEVTISNMREIAAIVELLEQRALCSKQAGPLPFSPLISDTPLSRGRENR